MAKFSYFVTGREILASGEARSRPGGGVSPGGEHGNAAVLELDSAEVVESLLVAVGDVAQRIPAAQLGRGGSDFVVEGTVEGRGRGGPGIGIVLRGGEGAGAGEEGGEEGELHHDGGTAR